MTYVPVDLNTIILAVLSLAGIIISAVIKKDINQVHVAVNSERTAMQASLAEMNRQITDLTGQKATLAEAARGAEIAGARAEGAARGKTEA